MCIRDHEAKMPFAFILSMIISSLTLSNCQFERIICHENKLKLNHVFVSSKKMEVKTTRLIRAQRNSRKPLAEKSNENEISSVS